MDNVKSTVILTPWGLSQGLKRWTDGIFEVETAAHGGFLLTSEWNAVIPDALKAGSANAEQCRQGWYEEDDDWAIVVISFPYIFGAKVTRQAIQHLRNNNPNFAPYLDGELEEFCRDSSAT
ncbi:hypothetical protein KF728_09520 [Candidatus Obscuribacterales bacterium]|nr:hypothetical protein [Candidatus Obscuribacterales bacterium]